MIFHQVVLFYIQLPQTFTICFVQISFLDFQVIFLTERLNFWRWIWLGANEACHYRGAVLTYEKILAII
jgi:hypothetical protein